MIPILYESTETAFTSNGLGRLSDCTKCLITEERNGVYELEMSYPITGAHYDLIQEGRIVAASHDEEQDIQPFVIYRISKPIDGIVTINAHHISYRLSDIIVAPVSGSSVSAVFSGIEQYSMTTNPFTFWTDNTTAGTLDIIEPRSVRAILGGQQGSILDVFGGEYEFDKFTVKNYAHRGNDNGVVIRYGKNLLNLNQERSEESSYNAIVPYWVSLMDGTVVYGGVNTQQGATNVVARAVDYSQEFQEQPTVAQLNAKAQSDLAAKRPWLPSENIIVDFVALWQLEEYEYIAPLERVKLCDTVTVIYDALGVQATAKVIKVVWNALTDKYDSIELGDAKSTFAQTIMQPVEKQIASLPTKSMMQTAINHATDLITGGLGGNIVYLYDADGYPTDMLIMDTKDIGTAVHVLRINVNGIGFSSNGIGGPYTSAWTLDGQFVADFITAGTMSANRINGGTLTLGGAQNGNGTMIVKDASNQTVVTVDKDGVDIDSGSIDLGNGKFNVSNAGVLRSQNGSEWFEIYDSVAKGGYGSTEDGLLDLSAQTGGNRDVALSALTNNVRLSGVDVTVTKTIHGSVTGSAVVTPSSDASAHVKEIYITSVGSGKGLAVVDGNGNRYWAELNPF